MTVTAEIPAEHAAGVTTSIELREIRAARREARLAKSAVWVEENTFVPSTDITVAVPVQARRYGTFTSTMLRTVKR